ncbi:acyl-CoA N-acyltransferase [Aspergillus unguis]
MRYNFCRLPNGIHINVSQVFGGFKFQTQSPEKYESFPPEWTICLSTKESDSKEASGRPWTVPTLDRDVLYPSSLSLPSCKDLKPSSAHTRIIAMVLWVTFFWYFQEPDPRPPDMSDRASRGDIPDGWYVTVVPHGMLSRKDQVVKVERLGILSSRDTSVGLKDGLEDLPHMFMSQKAFWQLDPRIHVYSISAVMPTLGQAYPPPPSSLDSLGIGFPFGAGPKTAGTFLPPYYPPQSLQYVYTDGIRHPLRPKAYKQGEVFYVRYFPSAMEYLTFRIPVLPTTDAVKAPRFSPDEIDSFEAGPDLCLGNDLANDVKIIYDWIQKRPADAALPRKSSLDEHSHFLEDRMCSNNSFPIMVCWDSCPTGYFELFWVREDYVGRALGGAADYDRGVRCFIGDEKFLEQKQLQRCMSSLVHHCWLYDQRTQNTVVECRLKHTDLVSALEAIGFKRVKEIESDGEYDIIMTIARSDWAAPLL